MEPSGFSVILLLFYFPLPKGRAMAFLMAGASHSWGREPNEPPTAERSAITIIGTSLF